MTPAIAEFTEKVSFPWSVENYGGKVFIDDYANMPNGTIVSIDIETNGKEVDDSDFKIVCIGITCDGVNCYIYFDLRPELFEYLRSAQLIAHNGKGAEIPWLSPYGITIDQLYFDTKIGVYAYDSSRKNYSLKPTLEALFGIKYPTYAEMITDKNFIEASCNDDNSLWLQDRKGNNKLPKSLTLDKIPIDIVAAYNACDIFWTYKLYTWLRQNFSVAQTNFFEQIEMPMNRLIFQMEKQGVQIDTKAVRRIHNETSKDRRRAAKTIFEITGTKFNLNSPKQLLPILRDNGIGVTSTGEEAVQSYGHIPLVKSLLEYRRTQKVCSTYTIPLYTNAIKSNDNRIHARFNQNTITGRLSSSDPINLQNQPPIVKECFVAKDNYKLIGSDWSNIELRLPAHFSGEPKFVNELARVGGDLHTVTARAIFGVEFDSLSDEEKKSRRSKAKTCNFLLTNSGTASRLKSELQCSTEEAEELFQKFWEGYPVLEAWLKEEKRKARLAGGVTSLYGRWVPIPQLVLWCGNYNCAKSGRFCKQCFLREEAERSAISCLVQGSAADMAKLVALRIWKEYGYAPILAVHDSLTYERPETVAERDMENIRFAMENVVKLRVPLKVDIGIGNKWSEVK